MPGADDQPVPGLTPEEEALLQERGGVQPRNLSLTEDEDTDSGVASDQTDQETDRPGQAQRQEPASQEQQTDGQPTEHPDNLPFLYQDEEEAAQELRRRLDESPRELVQRLRGGVERLTDYHSKNQARADRERELDRREQQLQEHERQLQQQQQQPGQQQQPQQQDQEAVMPQIMSQQEFAREFEAQHGRQANKGDWLEYQLQAQQEALQQMPDIIEQRVEQRTDNLEQAMVDQQMVGFEERANQQYEALCGEFPQASRPEVREEIVAELAERQSMLAKGDEMKRIFLYLHPEVVDEAREQGLNTRQEQVTRREEEAPPPSGPASETSPARPQTSDLDEIAEAQKNDPSLVAQLTSWYQERFR